jgi:hypothetical protein
MKYKTIEIFSDTTVGDDLFLSKILFENDNVILGEFDNLIDDIDIDKFNTNIKNKAKSLNFDLDLFDIIIENNKILLYYNDDLEFDRI